MTSDGGGLQKLASFFKQLSKAPHLFKPTGQQKTHRSEWNEASSPITVANMAVLGAFCASHKQVFSPLVPGYWEGYISHAGWMDGWVDGVERSRAERSVRSHTALTSPLVLQTSLMTSLTVLTQNVISTTSTMPF